MNQIVKVLVSKQIDGFTFSLLPSIRELIKKNYPGAKPVNTLFVSYDTKSDFETYQGQLEKFIYPALMGLQDSDLKGFKEVHFIDSQTGKLLQNVKP